MLALNAIPVVGWAIASVLCLFIAIPLSFLWNWLAPIYFYWLPPVYLDVPFWHMVGLLWLVISLRQILLPSLRAEVNNKKGD